ncbi:MAG: hypothetical protein E1N59_2375 [Puniceicoccaceae bacterium 5H]|nr:MAG: hypothetical protein E1N59_2375 [Puniceicoccaceae bacterium 5H]
MLIRLSQLKSPRVRSLGCKRAFTLVEVAVGFSIFAVVALGVTLAAMEYFKSTEDQSRSLAANSLAMSVLQQVSSYPYSELEVVTGSAGESLVAYDSQGNQLTFVNGGNPVEATFRTITRSGDRETTAENRVRLWMVVEPLTGRPAIRVTIHYTYNSAYSNEERENSLSTIRTFDEGSAET